MPVDAFAALFATALNNAVIRGWQGAGNAIVLFAMGSLAWVVPMGLVHLPMTSNLVTALCFFGSLGYSCGVAVVVYNQHQRLRAAREELRQGERRYRLIAEHAGGLVAMVDRDGRWLYASPSYARITGYAPEYRVWRSVSPVRDPDGRVTHYVTLFRELNGHGADARPAQSA